jgi:hypothetical protein
MSSSKEKTWFMDALAKAPAAVKAYVKALAVEQGVWDGGLPLPPAWAVEVPAGTSQSISQVGSATEVDGASKQTVTTVTMGPGGAATRAEVNRAVPSGLGSGSASTGRGIDIVTLCSTCGVTPEDPLRCSKCRRVYYCTAACQGVHRKAGHKAQCRAWAIEQQVRMEAQGAGAGAGRG